MNKDSQKRIIEINHAISGIFGAEVKSTAFKINQMRKETLKKLERKKKLAPIIHDELYSYLQKFPEEKLGLNQDLVKKKKAKLSQFEEKYPYKCPSFSHPSNNLAEQSKNDYQFLTKHFQYKLEQIESEDSENYKS